MNINNIMISWQETFSANCTVLKIVKNYCGIENITRTFTNNINFLTHK